MSHMSPVVLEDGRPLDVQMTRVLCFDAIDGTTEGPIVGYLGGPAYVPADHPVLPVRTAAGEEELSHIATFSTEMLSDVAPDLTAGHLVLLYAATSQPEARPYDEGARGSDLLVEGMMNGHQVVFVAEGSHPVQYEGGTAFPQKALVAREYDRIVVTMEDLAIISDYECGMIDKAQNRLTSAGLVDLSTAVVVEGEVRALQDPMDVELPAIGRALYQIETAPSDWVCIAQVPSLGGPNGIVPDSWCWAKEGTIYYFVTLEDLAETRFDRTICFLQSK